MTAELRSTVGDRDAFDVRGFAGPLPLLTRAECRMLVRALERGRRPGGEVWRKEAAVRSRVVFDVATRRSVLDAVAAVVGDDVMLWGAQVVRRGPGSDHPWHTDIESSNLGRRSVVVWISLEQAGRRSPLSLVSGSHALGESLQQVAAARGFRRGDPGDDMVLAWARERDPGAALASPSLETGDAVLFDGRLWHASRNRSRWRARTALVLHYAEPDATIRVPEYGNFEWPFRFRDEPRPPCLMVRGRDREMANEMVSPPVTGDEAQPALTTCALPLDLPLERDEAAGRRSRSLFRGTTPNVAAMACHATVLEAGRSPHAPHRHEEEEILLLLDGEAEIVGVEAGPSGPRACIRAVRAGTGVFHPAGSYHTIRNPGADPATYLMFKWRADAMGGTAALGTRFFDFAEPAPRLEGRGYTTRRVFEGATGALYRLQCHVTRLEPGAGYRPHVDAHDVAILLCDGEIEAVGSTLRPHGVVYAAGGHPHGMRNTGDAPAHYVVFEFHKGDAKIALPLRTRFRRRLRRLARRVPRLDRALRRRGRTFHS